MRIHSLYLAPVIAFMTFLGSINLWAVSDFAQDEKWTAEKMLQFVDLPMKSNLTSGFYDCMVAHIKDQPYGHCLPGELKFQEKIMLNLASQYSKRLPLAKQQAFTQLQKEFLTYRAHLCAWTDDLKSVKNIHRNPRVEQLKCLLQTAVIRRLELEKLLPLDDAE